MTQIATTIEQSKKLLELGLSPDTADMYYPKVDENVYSSCPFPKKCDVFRKQKSDISAWSWGALWDINDICGIGPNNFENKPISSEKLLDTFYRWICIELEEDAEGFNSFLLEEWLHEN